MALLVFCQKWQNIDFALPIHFSMYCMQLLLLNCLNKTLLFACKHMIRFLKFFCKQNIIYTFLAQWFYKHFFIAKKTIACFAFKGNAYSLFSIDFKPNNIVNNTDKSKEKKRKTLSHLTLTDCLFIVSWHNLLFLFPFFLFFWLIDDLFERRLFDNFSMFVFNKIKNKQ